MLIQTGKSVHERGKAGVSDVWFTGQRGAALPFGLVIECGTAEVTIDRILGRAPAFQTFCTVRLHDAAGVLRLRPFLTFAFKRDMDAA